MFNIKYEYCMMKSNLLNILESPVFFLCHFHMQRCWAACYFCLFPHCIVFCIPGSWRSVAYPPQQLVSAGDVCWLLAYIHYCHLLSSKTGIAHRDKDNLYAPPEWPVDVCICLWSISAAAASGWFLTYVPSSARIQQHRNVCCLMRES